MTVFDPAARLEELAAAAPERVAVRAPDVTWTYGDLAGQVGSAVGDLRRNGVHEGCVVELPVPGTPASVAGIVALHTIGATVYPVPAGRPLRITGDGSTAFVRVATAGTGGVPRVVPLTAQNVAASVESSRARLDQTADDRWLVCLPLHHVGGLSIVYRSLDAGGSLLVLPGFDTAAVVGALSGEASFVSLVPTMLTRLLAHGGPFTAVRAALLGGAGAAPGLVAEGVAAGLPILTTYGLTEAGSQVATVAPGEITASLGTAGRPLDGMVVSFAAGGELHVDGPAVFAGYVGGAPRTGPHPTGDVGRFDDAGRLVVTGRTDRRIITGGETVHPERIEAVLEAHPAVAAAVALGVPDAEWGEAVVAVVEAADIADADLVAWARPRLQRYEVPKAVHVVESLPRLASGKLDPEAARAQLE